jgi:cytochrome c oxidase subunit IV
MAHAADASVPSGHAPAAVHDYAQQHPSKLYLVVRGWLFVLSTFSYLVDYFQLQGYSRWALILLSCSSKQGSSLLSSCTWLGSGLP